MVISVLNLRPLLLKYWDICVNGNDEKRIASQTPPTGVRTFSDIPYIDDGTWQHKLDVYRPESKTGICPLSWIFTAAVGCTARNALTNTII